MSVFEELSKLNVNEHTEKRKNGSKELTYLSWTWAISEMLKVCPDMTYEVWRDPNTNLPYVYDENTGYMVFTRVTVDGVTKEMWLPVMDSHNAAMKKEAYTVVTKYSEYEVAPCTMFDVNKTIMRCLVKNFAMFGLGLYIYAGDDLPENVESEKLQKEIENAEEKPVGQSWLDALKADADEDNVDLAKVYAAYGVKKKSDFTMKVFMQIKSEWKKVVETCGK